MSLKNWLKKWLPAPAESFHSRMDTMERRLAVQNRQLEQIDAMQQTVNILTQQLVDRLCRLEAIQATADGQREIRELLEQMQKTQQQTDAEILCLQQLPAQVSELQDGQQSVVDLQKTIQKETSAARREASEAVWGEIFNNATSDSAWLENKAFSPGRWAVGYPALYAIYRILNEAHPKRILELGLGQSTRMIAQYAAAFEDVEHIVVEHDPEWIEFFKKDFSLSHRTDVVLLDCEMVSYKEAEAVRTFKGFKEQFSDKKFDFIFIDAPLGSDMKQYSRIDILSIIPQCLRENFAIMIDDYMRKGEQNTVDEIKTALREEQIENCCGIYRGGKDTCVVTTKKYQFLSTL